MARVVFATMGSWGDLFPTIGLAKAMAARGHAVRVATTSAYASLVEDEGLPFVSAGPRFGPEEFAADPAILDGRQGGYAGFLHLFRTVVFPNLSSWVEDLRGALEDADLLVSHPTVLASPIAAELTETRWVTFSVFPGLIPSEGTLPSPTGLRLPTGPVGRGLRRGAWRMARWNIRRSFDPAVNAARVAFGLSRVRDALFVPVKSGNPYLVGASPHVVQVPADWPANIRLTGFFAWDTPGSYSPPDGLEDFFAAGRAPILITLGGSSAVDPQQFYPNAVRATRRLGHRALVLGGPTPQPLRLDPSPDTYVLPFAPLSQIGARCLAAVHHGGIGTTVGLLAAGLPQLIVPRGFDQPQTALRMNRLGVATITPWSRASAPALERGLAHLLSTEDYRHRASAFAAWLQHERGRDNAADAIEQALA
ncbi:MAG: glycosyltransferase [Solirubrobacteraceae bacterium]